MAAASRSCEINLYALEDKLEDAYRVQMATTVTDFELSGPQSAKFDFASMQIKDGASYYNLTDHIAAAESQQSGDSASLAASVAANQAAIAQEQVDRQAQDTVLGNQISSEISARATAVQAVQDALDLQEQKQSDDDTAQSTALAAEISDRTAAVSAEAAARTADVAGLQGQLTNLVGANTPGALQNLSAIVTAFQGADVTHTSALASLVTRMDAVEALLNQLVSAGL